jgi:hypothetical protein
MKATGRKKLAGIGKQPGVVSSVRPELAGVSCRARFFSALLGAATLFRVRPGEKRGKKGGEQMETHWIVIVLGQLAGLLTG